VSVSAGAASAAHAEEVLALRDEWSIHQTHIHVMGMQPPVMIEDADELDDLPHDGTVLKSPLLITHDLY